MAAQPVTGPTLQTLATQRFQNLKYEDFIEAQFDKTIAFERALKVFRMSYAEFEDIYVDTYYEKLTEFVHTISALLEVNVPKDDVVNMFLSNIDQQIELEQIGIKVSATRFKGLNQMKSARIEVKLGMGGQPYYQELDTTNEMQSKNIQPFLPCDCTLQLNQLRRLRRNNSNITIRLIGEQWLRTEEELEVFEIKYQELSAEGYEDWFDFGRGVRLLIKIEIRVTVEPSLRDQKYPLNFHLHIIIEMLWRRVNSFRAQTSPSGTGHRSAANKSKISYIRKKVNINEAFWPTPQDLTDLMQAIRKIRSGSDPIPVPMKDPKHPIQALRGRQTVKYNDIQIGFDFTDEFEDSVCLCSQWCNWNAFFHFNPIYRFLLVQHNRLYLSNRTNIPDIYLLAVTYVLYKSSSGAPPLPKTPLLQLMSCANEYRIQYWNIFLANHNLQTQYMASRPRPRDMNGTSYNGIRHWIEVVSINIQSDPNPFADICIENLINYHKVLSDLHTYCSLSNRLVDPNNTKDWNKEFDRISRSIYKDYVRTGYLRVLHRDTALTLQVVDHMFSEDYEYSSFLPQSQYEREIKRIRENLTNAAFPANPFNFRIMLNKFALTLILIHKFIRKVDPMLSSPRSSHSRFDVFDVCQMLDNDFEILLQNRKNFQYFWNKHLIALEFMPIERSFYVLYTLKLYLIGFGIQSYCVKALLAYNGTLKANKYIQVCPKYHFIWRNDWIENIFRGKYTNEWLFMRRDDITNSINAFYGIFWGRAAHETQLNPTLDTAVDSALEQYQRLYFWWRNNGNDRRIFTRISDSVNNIIEDVVNRSEIIYTQTLLDATHRLSTRFEYYLEVLDVLVYYLVKANCYMVLSTLSSFMVGINALQFEDLVKKNIHFTLCKPGWVPLFRTMRTVMNYLNKIKAKYIVFDDEFDRISKAVNETKTMVKEIYRLYYHKIIVNWIAEEVMILGNANLDPFTASLVVVFHLALCVSFMGALVDDFRKQSQSQRKWFKYAFGLNVTQSQYNLAFNECQQIIEDYLHDRPERTRAQPLLSHHWQNHSLFTQNDLFVQLDQQTGQQLGIVLNLANI